MHVTESHKINILIMIECDYRSETLKVEGSLFHKKHLYLPQTSETEWMRMPN